MANDSNLPSLNIGLIFRKYDQDADGFIGVEDLVSVFRELDESLTEAEIQEHLQNAGNVPFLLILNTAAPSIRSLVNHSIVLAFRFFPVSFPNTCK